jgi:hypothetical protein
MSFGSSLGGGGGGGPPQPKQLKQVSTSLGGKLYQTAANIAKQWSGLSLADYFGPNAPAWRQPLGAGAKAMMTQAAAPLAGQQDPQTQAALRSGGFGNVNLGSTPYEVAMNLGQAPLQQLQRNQNFATSMLNLWKTPSAAIPLTGATLTDVALQTAAQRGDLQAQQLQAQLAGQSLAQQSALQAQGLATGAFGRVATAGINQFGNIFGGGQTPPAGMDYYAAGSPTSQALGPAMEAAQPGGTSWMSTGQGA